jgi:hypothetical protein
VYNYNVNGAWVYNYNVNGSCPLTL